MSMKMERHSLPPGRLKMAHKRISNGQCFSIIVLVLIAPVSLAMISTSSRGPIQSMELPLSMNQGNVADKQFQVEETNTSTREITSDMIMDPMINSSPVQTKKKKGATDSSASVAVPPFGVDKQGNQLSSGNVMKLKDSAGGTGETEATEVVRETTSSADTISYITVAFSTSSSGSVGRKTRATSSATTERTTTTTTRMGRKSKRTALPDEAELSPQNDQPSRFGQQQHEDVVVGDDGLDSGRGYYRSNNKMSNGMLEGASSHQPQERHSVAEGKGFTDTDIQCPSLKENSACPCYKFDDGLVLDCPGTTAFSLRTTLQVITAPIQSLSVFDFDRSVTVLTPDVFTGGKLNIRHLQFSQSHLEVVADNALRAISSSLESLSFVNGKLTRIPQKAISGMDRLTVIDLEANEIQEVGADAFSGLHLAKLSLKSNRVAALQPNAFRGVEMTLSEINLSDNKLQSFPLIVLRQLDNLRSLRLASNEMSALLWDGHIKLPSLHFLDLSNNRFSELGEHFFQPFTKLKTLSLFSNALHLIHHNAFQCLKELVSVDISHNHLISLDRSVFEANKKLQTIDLSHNHLHYVDDMFTNLPFLREVFLNENNILEMSRDVFTNSTRLTNVYLEQNAIRRIDGHLLDTQTSLQQLFLSGNLIVAVGKDFLRTVIELTTFSLDGNWMDAVERGLFHSLVKLRELRLQGNRLKHISKSVFNPLPALTELHLQNNQISSIERDAFVTLISLLHLNLQHNRLQKLDVTLPNGALSSVHVDSNRLTSLGDSLLRGQTHLQSVWLGDNQLTTLHRDLFSDLTSIEHLHLPNNSIERLTDDTFKELVDLRVLNLSGNSLTEVKRTHFSPHLSKLEELVLRGNRIQSIEARSFDKLRRLRVLDLSENFLATLTKDMFQDDLQINTIDLHGSRVRHIEPGTLRSMNNLYDLNLEDNQLTADDVRQFEVPSLRVLLLSNNIRLNSSGQPAGSIYLDRMFDKLPSLQTLRMANCNIHELPELIFTRNTNLVRIELSHNALRSLPRMLFGGLNVLKELRLEENQFTEFPNHALYNISGLETLALSHNQLTSIDFSKLNGLPSIRHLDISDNLISSMSGFSALNVTQLEFVDLSGNYLLALPSNFFLHSINLQRINLSRNRFQHIPSNALGDSSLPRLNWLNLSGNPLNVFYDNQAQQTPPARFAYLKELHIRNTNLTIVTSQDFQAFPALQQLLMTHNRINRISPGAFNSLRSLLTLDISVNELEKVPKERLQGLKLLRCLNLSHNVLKELDEFPEDLKQLRQLDLSFNQLVKLGKNVLRNLVSLKELYLVGNRLKVVAGETLRNVHQLQSLDLRQNYFEHIPLAAIQVVEAHLKTLRIEDNPIQCSCDTQELWEWLRNHLKLILSPMNHNIGGDLPSRSDNALVSSLNADGKQGLGSYGIRTGDGGGSGGFSGAARGGVGGGGYASRNRPDEFLGDEGFAVADGSDVLSEFFSSHLRCDQPTRLRGRVLMEMEPHRFCDAPLILKVAIQDIQPYSVLVSWQTREHSGLHGYHVVYRSMEDGGDANVVRSVTLDRWASSAKLFRLAPGTQYQICVVGIGNIWEHSTPTAGDLVQSMSSTSYYYSAESSNRFGVRSTEENSLEALLRNNVTTKCDEVVTLDVDTTLMMDEHGMVATSFIQSLLTRRLGLIVGCCLGIIVFIVLISVLGWLKVKKQRILEETKRMEAHPPDFISYQPYSISHEEQQNTVLQTGVDIGQNTLLRGGAHHTYQQQQQLAGCGGNGRSGVYISRSEFTSPMLMTSTASGTEDGGVPRMQSP